MNVEVCALAKKEESLALEVLVSMKLDVRLPS